MAIILSNVFLTLCLFMPPSFSYGKPLTTMVLNLNQLYYKTEGNETDTDFGVFVTYEIHKEYMRSVYFGAIILAISSLMSCIWCCARRCGNLQQHNYSGSIRRLSPTSREKFSLPPNCIAYTPSSKPSNRNKAVTSTM